MSIDSFNTNNRVNENKRMDAYQIPKYSQGSFKYYFAFELNVRTNYYTKSGQYDIIEQDNNPHIEKPLFRIQLSIKISPCREHLSINTAK